MALWSRRAVERIPSVALWSRSAVERIPSVALWSRRAVERTPSVALWSRRAVDSFCGLEPFCGSMEPYLWEIPRGRAVKRIPLLLVEP